MYLDAPARADGRLTDMLSFYTLPSTVINNPLHSKLAAAFQYYTVPGATPLIQLMGDALILAHNTCAACSPLPVAARRATVLVLPRSKGAHAAHGLRAHSGAQHVRCLLSLACVVHRACVGVQSYLCLCLLASKTTMQLMGDALILAHNTCAAGSFLMWFTERLCLCLRASHAHMLSVTRLCALIHFCLY